MLRLILASSAFALTFFSATASAQECKAVTTQLTQEARLNPDDGGYLVLRQRIADRNPYLIQESCVVVDNRFWPKNRRGRFLYLGVINFVPSDEEPDTSYLGIQAIRRNPLRNGSDVIRLYRNAQWIRQTDKGIENLQGILGRVAPLTVADWKALHGDPSTDLAVADARMKAKWHAQPAEDVPSSWELKNEWASPFTYNDGTLLTNLLLRFTTNRDANNISIVAFEIGVPQDADEIVIEVHSNIDAFRKTVRLVFP